MTIQPHLFVVSLGSSQSDHDVWMARPYFMIMSLGSDQSAHDDNPIVVIHAQLYERAIGLCPRRASSYAALAFAHQLLGDLDRAIECYHRSLGIRPDDAFAASMLSRALSEVLAVQAEAAERGGGGGWEEMVRTPGGGSDVAATPPMGGRRRSSGVGGLSSIAKVGESGLLDDDDDDEGAPMAMADDSYDLDDDDDDMAG